MTGETRDPRDGSRRDEPQANDGPPAVRDALASHFDDYAVVRRLHDVPPHAVYEVVAGGTRAVCKLATGPRADPAAEARVLQHVARETAVPVPRVLAVGDDHFVAAWHDGLPDDPVADVAWARAAGAGMATLHAGTPFDAPGFARAGDGGLRLDARPTWRDVLVDLLADRRAYLAGRGHADVADAAVGFLRDHPGALAGAGDPVLCHGNYLPEHVGVADAAVAGVVDFEHALVGPAEWDFWRTAMPTFEGPFRPGAAGPPGPLHRAFRAGYESVRPLPAGFDRRAPVYWTLGGVSYLTALFLQDRHGPAETRRRAAALREFVIEGLHWLADRLD